MALLASCESSTGNNVFEPDVAKMTITLSTTCSGSGTEYSATEATNGFGGVSASVSTGLFCVRSTFFRPNGAMESSLPAQDFELRVSTSSSGVVMTPPLAFEPDGSRPLQGILSGLEPGEERTFYFSLFHTTQGHADFGPYPLKIRYVAPPPPGGGGGGSDF
jgi:hypothetical protein